MGRIWTSEEDVTTSKVVSIKDGLTPSPQFASSSVISGGEWSIVKTSHQMQYSNSRSVRARRGTRKMGL